MQKWCKWWLGWGHTSTRAATEAPCEQHTTTIVPGWGLHPSVEPGTWLRCWGSAGVRGTNNFLPGSSRLGFCSTQRSWMSPFCCPHEGHVLGREPSLWHSLNELCSPAPTVGGSSHPCRPLCCLDVVWPTAYVVTCVKTEVLDSPPWLKRGRTHLPSQLGKRCEFCYKRYHFTIGNCCNCTFLLSRLGFLHFR